MAFNQSCYGLRAKSTSGISTDYLYFALKHYIELLKAEATGSKFDAITTKTFAEVHLPVPDPKVQGQIIRECEAVDGSMAKIVEEGVALGDVPRVMSQRKAAVFEKYL
ncbi:MAG: hypothetical protein HC901_00880 [Bdellovibrionaceae bacterium]|nr:hypothetical protein [Pseudobdellovibrionaceae bacterium]